MFSRLIVFVFTLFSCKYVKSSDHCGILHEQEDADYNFWDKKGNTDLLKALNAALYEIKQDLKTIADGLGGTAPDPPNVPWPSSTGKSGTFKYLLEKKNSFWFYS
eukprot:TRINITY_DN693_c0_g2_i1.p1 TRINITY_DN693_c0_g2~~TRINITY_DN693_c0_g2_i1.p1  ORF type:complete len:105 (+),score=17.93 TRINITY_DN693_c0_g2_i1:104-418(+)